MSQTLSFNIRGLATYANDTQVPAGSLVVANNIDLSAPGLAKPRRGFDNHSAQAATDDRNYALLNYSDTLFSFVNGSTLYGYIASSWTSKGALTKPTYAKNIRAVGMSKCLFVTSSSGLKKLDSTSNSLYAAGIPQGLHMTLATSVSTGTAVDAADYVAYRYLIARKDAQNNTIQGAPGARAIILNAQVDARDVTVICYIPSGLTAAEHYIQLYRSTGSTAVPNDEMLLCYELPITAGHISAGYATITDIVIDDLLGATLYTSPSQQGIANANNQPPLASDICEFKGYMFYGDVESKYRITSTLIACGGSTGFVVDDTFTIVSGVTTETYTAKASDNYASKQFTVDVASVSLSVRIDSTIRNLIDCINQKSTLVYAFLLSTGAKDLPGKIVLESRSLGGSAFTIASSRATCWSPQLSSSPGTSQTAINDSYKNGLMFSKNAQPEAVPTKNILFAGSSDDRIQRIIALKDSLIILKGKDGAYVLRGQTEGSFVMDKLDSTARIIAPESAVVVNNLIYCLSESGVCQISDNGVSIISQGIKNKINDLFSTDLLTPTREYSFGMAYETEGKYYLCLPGQSTDTYSTYQLVYDVFNNVWVESNLVIKSGFVNPTDNKLYLGSGNSKYVKNERKSYDYSDFVDFIQTCTVSAQSGRVVTINGFDAMTVGDILLQGTLEPSYISSIDLINGTVTIDNDQTFTLSTADVNHYAAINTQIEWSRDFAGNPAGLKHFSEAIFAFKREYLGTSTFGFSSDLASAVTEIEVSGPEGADGWGYTAWGDGAWGGDVSPNPVRVGIPRGAARCNALSVVYSNYKAYSSFELTGFSLVYTPTSTRTSRSGD